MNQIKLSIIIPHFNIPHLLMRCLQSIPETDDIQVIVVDDNSPNCENYIKEYPLLSRTNTEFHILANNGGGGKARNEGLKHVKGEWVLFADADDFFNYNFIEAISQYIYTENQYDIVYFNANSLDSETYENSPRAGYVNQYIHNFLASNNDFEVRYIFGEPWCKLIRFELIAKNNIKFDETPIHNDATFSYLIGYYAKKITADKRAIYCLTDRPNSVSKVLTDELHMIRLSIFFRKYSFLKNHRIKQYPMINDIIYRTLLHYKVNNDKKYYNKCIDIAVSCGIEKKIILKEIKNTFKSKRLHNRKILFKEIVNKVLNKI